MLSRREFLQAALLAYPALGLLLQEKPDAFAKLVAHRWKSHEIGQLTGEIAIELIGIPYVGSTLEISDDREECVVNLAGLDCVTMYETALGLARMILARGSSRQDLIRQITALRYRGGRLNGYLSRLHYTSDWIADNANKHFVHELTPNLPGAVRMDKKFDFMSTHPDSYRQLKAHPEWVAEMATLEDRISARKPFYVPNDRVAQVEPLLRTGDIVGIATSAAGLDCSHTGLVYVDESRVRRFLNASSVKKEVVLGERLSEYANKYKKNLGVMIVRPLPVAR